MKLIMEILFFSFSFEFCFYHCKDCYEESEDENDMKCISCQEDYYFIYNTTNCVNPEIYKNYYLNQTDFCLYPCLPSPNTNSRLLFSIKFL